MLIRPLFKHGQPGQVLADRSFREILWAQRVIERPRAVFPELDWGLGLRTVLPSDLNPLTGVEYEATASANLGSLSAFEPPLPRAMARQIAAALSDSRISFPAFESLVRATVTDENLMAATHPALVMAWEKARDVVAERAVAARQSADNLSTESRKALANFKTERTRIERGVREGKIGIKAALFSMASNTLETSEMLSVAEFVGSAVYAELHRSELFERDSVQPAGVGSYRTRLWRNAGLPVTVSDVGDQRSSWARDPGWPELEAELLQYEPRSRFDFDAHLNFEEANFLENLNARRSAFA